MLQTISLTVMILEGTGDMQYVLPLMLTVMSARWTGNIFTEGIYDMAIHSANLAFLDEDESVSRLVTLHDLTVSDIMTQNPIYMFPVMTVGDVYDLLKKGKHNCYPVGKSSFTAPHHTRLMIVHIGLHTVLSNDDRILVGSILRKTVCTVMKRRAFSLSAENTETAPVVSWEALESSYPHYPDLKELIVAESDR